MRAWEALRAGRKRRAANHPATFHACQDLCQADFTTFPAHDVLLASPACQGHTPARGKDRPHHDACRSTAWAVVACAEVHRPAAVLVENVPEFCGWTLYPAWKSALEALGYAVSATVLDAQDFGVPQHRERVFVLALKGRTALPITLPKRERVPCGSILRWNAGAWSPVEKPGRAAATLARVAAGRAQFGERFVLAYYGTERGGRSLALPLGTVTTRERFAVVHGERMRMLAVDEYRAAMGFPANYRLPQNKKLAVHMLGNAVCPPVARDVLAWLKKNGLSR